MPGDCAFRISDPEAAPEPLLIQLWRKGSEVTFWKASHLEQVPTMEGANTGSLQINQARDMPVLINEERYSAGLKEMQDGQRVGFAKILYTRVFYPDGSGDLEHSKGTLMACSLCRMRILMRRPGLVLSDRRLLIGLVRYARLAIVSNAEIYVREKKTKHKSSDEIQLSIFIHFEKELAMPVFKRVP